MDVQTLRTVCGVISVVVALVGTVPYFASIVKGRTRPHQLTWLVFTIMNGIVTVSQYLSGARSSVLISATYFVASFAIFLMSYRYGVRGSSRYDWLLFGMSLATIVVWLFTKNNVIAIWLTVLIDVFATSMTILKIRNHRGSEDHVPWLIASLAYVFACMALVGTPLSILYVRPIYALIGDLLLVVVIVVGKRRVFAVSSTQPGLL